MYGCRVGVHASMHPCIQPGKPRGLGGAAESKIVEQRAKWYGLPATAEGSHDGQGLQGPQG